MILSVSRRTDIPAFFSEWFRNRLREGYVMIRNPFNPNQIRRIEIHPSVVDGFVFWSKHPRNFFPVLDDLAAYPYYFQYTITPYNASVERKVPPLAIRIETFRELSRLVGADRLIWRYDPVFFPAGLDRTAHRKAFDTIAGQLSGYTNQCTISFLQEYQKCRRNLRAIRYTVVAEEEKIGFAASLQRIAETHGIRLTACAEPADLRAAGVERARCVDAERLARILNKPLIHRKDRHQRPACGCSVSTDIGAYNTCAHGCLYCYAQTNAAPIPGVITHWDPASPFLSMAANTLSL